jgi:hypothetical protein
MEKKQEVKKVYQKPTISYISLRMDEVLAVGCKLSTGGPPPTGLGCELGGCAVTGS